MHVCINLLALFVFAPVLDSQCTVLGNRAGWCQSNYTTRFTIRSYTNRLYKMATYTIDSLNEYKGIKVVHANIRSLLHNFDDIAVNLLNGLLDIVVLTESWLHENCADSLISVAGYKHYRLDRQTLSSNGSRKKGGGIIIYVKHGYSVATHSQLDSSDKDLEIMSISCKLGFNKRINVSAVYRPPTGNVQSAMDKIEVVVRSIRGTTSGYTVVTGDLNVDLLTPSTYATKVRQFACSCNLVQLINDPTRFSPKSQSLIDHVYTNARHLSKSGVIDYHVSDHLPVFMVIKKAKSKSNFREVIGRTYKDFDETAFRADISDLDPNQIFCDYDPETVWDPLYSHIVSIVNAHCPLRILRLTTSRPKYLTDDILALMRERDKAFKAARTLNSANAWHNARTLCSKVAKELRAAKRNYILKQLDAVKGDGRKFWHIINSSFFPKASTQITQVFGQQSGDLLEGVDAANEINNYFCKVSVQLSNKFANVIYADSLPEAPIVCDSIQPLSLRRVTEEINLIDKHKSSGFIEIPSKLLKVALQAIPDTLTLLLNLCINSSTFPQTWKKGIVVCIPKSGDYRLLTNLRPISTNYTAS